MDSKCVTIDILNKKRVKSMPMRIIRGAIGSGKADLCLSEIERRHEENPAQKCIMIVPNHYSYETERKFVEHFGGTGLNNIEVLTLRKMAINCLSAAELKYLTPAGKQMLIYKAVNDYCADTEIIDAKLISSIRKPGFLDVMASLISELKRYSVTPDMLGESACRIENNDALKNKVSALGEIYGMYSGFVGESGYTDSEDDIKRLSEYIAGSDEFGPDTYVWFSKFGEFTPHQLGVIEALLSRGANVTVCVKYPENDNGLYAENQNTFYRLGDLAAVYGDGGVISLEAKLSHMKNKDIRFLFENWNNPRAVFKDSPENISLFESRDAYEEVEYTAGRIVDLVREEGLRFRDISVLCGNADEYQYIVQTVFSEYDIPYFTDSTIILSDHPIALQILSLFEIFEEDWSYEAVFSYLRAGYIYEERNGKFKPLSQNKVDMLENFVLRWGIRGQSRWLSETAWTKSRDIISTAFGGDEEDEDESFFDELRREIAAPIAEFKEATSRRRTAKEHASALFNYFESINLYTGLKNEITRLRSDGRLTEAEQFTSIWNLLLEVLNQTVVTVGNEKMNRAEFCEYIRAGLSKCEIRTIPSGIDQVYVGTVERSSQSNVRAMFVIGAVGGTFPDERNDEGFLSNYDRGELEAQYGIRLAPDTKTKMEKQYFKVYRALCAVTDMLFLSYPLQNSEGRALRASRMIIDIHRKFPKLRIFDRLPGAEEKIYISSPKATIHKMLINKSGGKKAEPVWEAAYRWYQKSGSWDNMLSMLDSAGKFSARDIKIDSELARKLYEEKGAYSASRLNAYARCPFGYFIKYGIGAYERSEWKITPADVGSYAHAVIKEFCERVEEGAATSAEKLDRWKSLRERGEEGTAPVREEILDDIINTTKENMLSSKTRDREKTASIFGRMGKTICSAARIVHMSFKNGQYAEDGMERHFELDLGDGIRVKGDIDRLDVFDKPGSDACVRIIDYKTGKTSFDVVDICNKIDMQPVIYAIAARSLVREELDKSTAVTGIYYNKVRDDFEKLKSGDGEEKADEKHGRARRLDGVTFIDNTGDNRVIYDMDSSLERGSDSEFLNISAVDGTVALNENIRTRSEIEGLMKTVSNNIAEIDSEIKSGNISLSPYVSPQAHSCDFCDYRSVCAFDGDRREDRKREGDKTEVWELMKKRGDEI